jgi:hypothetical protein
LGSSGRIQPTSSLIEEEAMNRQEMVDLLTSHTTSTPDGASRRPDFAKLSERLLQRELQFRGLIGFEEPDIFDEDDGGMSGDELNVLVAGARGSRVDNHFFD